MGYLQLTNISWALGGDVLNLPARAAQGCSHEENDNSQWLPMNILGVSESGDVLLTSAVDFKHPSALGANVQEPRQSRLLMDAALLLGSVWGSVSLALYSRDVVAGVELGPFHACS